MSVRAALNLFKRLQSENFDVKDAFQFGHPVTNKVNELELDRRISYDITEDLRIDQKNSLDPYKDLLNLKNVVYSRKLDTRALHELSE